jgi:hypothetical protein
MAIPPPPPPPTLISNISPPLTENVPCAKPPAPPSPPASLPPPPPPPPAPQALIVKFVTPVGTSKAVLFVNVIVVPWTTTVAMNRCAILVRNKQLNVFMEYSEYKSLISMILRLENQIKAIFGIFMAIFRHESRL